MTYPIGKEEWEKEWKPQLPDRTIRPICSYFSIVENNYEICKKYKRKADNVETTGADRIECELSNMIVIVFSALFLEALINDYAASNKPEVYTDKELEKHCFMAKWKHIPRAITGKDFNPKTLNSLKKLTNLRKNLVHYKTKKMPKEYERWFKFTAEEIEKFYSDAEIAYNCVNECFQELLKIDNTNYKIS